MNQRFFIYILLTVCIFIHPLTVHAEYMQFMGEEKEVHFKSGLYDKIKESERIPAGDSEQWVKSGYYSYEFLDSGKRYITIRKIEPEAVQKGKLIVPGEIDSHKVLGIGIQELPPYAERKNYCVMEKAEIIEELVLPDGLEFLGAASFDQCKELKKIFLPNSLVIINQFALAGCEKLKEIKFPPGVFVSGTVFGSRSWEWVYYPQKITLYSDSVFVWGFLDQELAEVHIRKHGSTSFFLEYLLSGNIKKLYIDKKLDLFRLVMTYADEDSINLTDYHVDKLIMNGKNTSLDLSEKVNDIPPSGGLKGLYTVKGAISILEAKTFRIPSYWKTAGKAKEVKAKKKNGTYQANWKKIKTTVCKYYFNRNKNKWATKKTPAKTVYKVYGKKKKSGSYQLIKTTKKRSIKSKYKYIKAVPVKEWD